MLRLLESCNLRAATGKMGHKAGEEKKANAKLFANNLGVGC